MKIDENGNLEIESEKDYKQGKINDYGFTSNPEQLIYTKDLMHCIGLALISESKGVRKRGLIHVHYNREFIRNGDGNISIPEKKAGETNKVLENFIRDFEGKKGKIFKNPRAIMIYRRSMLIDRSTEKINLKDDFTEEFNEREIKDENRYENPMADHIRNWLRNRNIDLYFQEATSNEKLPSILNMNEDPKEIHHKEFALKHDKIRVGMYNRKGILLNRNDYEAELDF